MTKKRTTTADDKKLNALFEQIAKEHLFIETLEERHSDRLDFHDVGVVGLRDALRAAYEAGRQVAK